jgi:Fic family protein
MRDKSSLSTYRLFFALSESDFELYLENAKKEGKIFPLHCGTGEIFYHRSEKIVEQLISLSGEEARLLLLLDGLPAVAREELIRTSLIDEVYQTNLIEGVYSTRKEIFRLLDDFSHAKQNRITSIVNKYRLLLDSGFRPVKTLEDLRHLYDSLMSGAYALKDKPDGVLFRQGAVSVTDGIKEIQHGLYPEEKIGEALTVSLEVLNGEEFSAYERLAISHFFFEYAHPFYDGNGRMGRFLLSLYALKEKPEAFSFRLASAIGEGKAKYYKAFKETEDVRNSGDLATFVSPMLSFFQDDYEDFFQEIEKKKGMASALRKEAAALRLHKGERKTAEILAEGTVWSAYGLRYASLVKAAGADQRTIQRHLVKFVKSGWAVKTKIGRQSYFRLTLKGKNNS